MSDLLDEVQATWLDLIPPSKPPPKAKPLDKATFKKAAGCLIDALMRFGTGHSVGFISKRPLHRFGWVPLRALPQLDGVDRLALCNNVPQLKRVHKEIMRVARLLHSQRGGGSGKADPTLAVVIRAFDRTIDLGIEVSRPGLDASLADYLANQEVPRHTLTRRTRPKRDGFTRVSTKTSKSFVDVDERTVYVQSFISQEIVLEFGHTVDDWVAQKLADVQAAESAAIAAEETSGKGIAALGRGSYQVGNDVPVSPEYVENKTLEAFLDRAPQPLCGSWRSLKLADLETAGVAAPHKVMARLAKKFPEQVRLPRTSGRGGYAINIHPTESWFDYKRERDNPTSHAPETVHRTPETCLQSRD